MVQPESIRERISRWSREWDSASLRTARLQEKILVPEGWMIVTGDPKATRVDPLPEIGDDCILDRNRFPGSARNKLRCRS